MRIEHYDIDMDIDEKTKEYIGMERILLGGDEENFVINTLNHKIIDFRLNGKKVELENGKKDEEKIIKGRLTDKSEIMIEFSAHIPEALTGLYLAKTSDGSEMISTQFESIGARRAFPCFDEPLLKATFSLKVTIASNLEAISNMPVKRISQKKERKTIEFETTPRMPTYLLYIGIGVFKTIHRKHGNIDIYLTGLALHTDTTEFPLDVAERCIDFFSEYTGIPYMLPKMHMISVPEFAAGAMENWGAIAFRETALLHNESSGNASKKRIASVIAHEIAHQWFGDLVTMKYWNDLWLNESFATHMGNKAIESIYPEWDITSDSLISDGRGAFLVDSLESSNPVSPAETDMDKMGERSNEITYGKGAMILRMVEGYVGSKRFRKGLRNYLVKYSYSNADATDLWHSISESSDRDVSGIMDAWITKDGYPLINVLEKGNISIIQERFLLSGKTDDRLWPIPLTVKRKKGIESILFDKKESMIDGKGFIKLNNDESGFYRVIYTDRFYANLDPSDEDLTEPDKIGIVSDLYALFISGRKDLEAYLSTVDKFTQSKDYNLSILISNQLTELYHILNRNDYIIKEFTKFHKQKLKSLEIDRSDYINRSILHGLVLRRLAEADEETCRKLASRFQFIEKEDPDLRNAIAFAFIKNNGNMNSIIKKYESLSSDNDRVAIISSLGYLKGKDSMERVFSLIKEGKIKKQDEVSYYTSLETSEENRAIAFDIIENIVARLNEISPGGRSASNLLANILPYVGEGRIVDVQNLMDKVRNDKNKLGISKGLEKLEIFEKLRQKYNR